MSTSKRVVYDKPVAGDASLVGTLSKPLPPMHADMLIREGYAHLAGSKEDAEAKAERDHKAAVTRNAEKEARALEYAKNGDPSPATQAAKVAKVAAATAAEAQKAADEAAKAPAPDGETKKQRKVREKVVADLAAVAKEKASAAASAKRKADELAAAAPE